MSEGEYLEVTEISKEQSGVYECSASNDVSAPDVRKVHVTVNCKCMTISAPYAFFYVIYSRNLMYI